MLRLNCLKQHVCPYCYGLDACPVSPRQLQILLITLSNYSTWLRCTTEWKRYVRDFAMASRSAFHASCTQSLQHHISKLLQVKCVIFFWDTAYKPIWSKFAFPLKFQSALWLLHRQLLDNNYQCCNQKGFDRFWWNFARWHILPLYILVAVQTNKKIHNGRRSLCWKSKSRFWRNFA